MSNIYVLDTSALIDLQVDYPPDIFANVWEKFDELARDRLLAPKEVFGEICSGNEFLYDWCRNHKRIFLKNNTVILKYVKEIMHKFPKLVNPDKLGPVADPFVIAFARSLAMNVSEDEPVILTHEKNSPNSYDKIPAVAGSYNIKCVTLLDLFNAENWKF